MASECGSAGQAPGDEVTSAVSQEASQEVQSRKASLDAPPQMTSERSAVSERSATPPVSVSARLGRLQFHLSGKFRVLQVSDIQDGPKISPDTIALLEASVDASRPDVVVFTGNQIAGYDEAYAATFRKRRWTPVSSAADDGARARRRAADMQHTRELVRSFMGRMVQPLVDRGIPWAVTYGNHDAQCGLDVAELDAMYRELPGCLNPPLESRESLEEADSVAAAPRVGKSAPSKRRSRMTRVMADYAGLPQQPVYACEPGTLALPVLDERGEHTVCALMVVNSGDYVPQGGYGSPSAQALEFMQMMPRCLGARILAFQHMPIPQHYDVLKRVRPTAAHAIEGYRTRAGHTFVLDDAKVMPGSYLGEGISCPDEDCGEFAILRKGQYVGLSAAHDHRNGFVGVVDGVMLAATPTCGFGTYGPVPAKRAVRLFEFDIRHPHEPRTQLLEFGELVGKPSAGKAYTYAMTGESRPDEEGMDLLRKRGWWGGLLQALRRFVRH